MPISHYPEHISAFHADTAPRRVVWSDFRVFLKDEWAGRITRRRATVIAD